MKTATSKSVIDKAALIFLRHPGQVYTRADIQSILGVSKATACRVMTLLSEKLSLQEVNEGQRIYYSLSVSAANRITNVIDFTLAISDRERLALNFLLNKDSSSALFNNQIESLAEKLDKIGLIVPNHFSIKETKKNIQTVNDENEYIIDSLLTALETKTRIQIKYKGAFSDTVKTHELCPVGLYLRDENLYLYAYSEKHKDATSFAYSRIKSISLIYDSHYTIPEEITADDVVNDPFGINLSQKRHVTVHIYGHQVFYEKEKKWPEGTTITDLPDGSMRIELTISDPYAFRTWALSLGKNCLVEKPDDIADWIYNEHKEAAEHYHQF